MDLLAELASSVTVNEEDIQNPEQHGDDDENEEKFGATSKSAESEPLQQDPSQKKQAKKSGTSIPIPLKPPNDRRRGSKRNNPEMSSTSRGRKRNNPEMSSTSGGRKRNNPEMSSTSRGRKRNNPEMSSTTTELLKQPTRPKASQRATTTTHSDQAEPNVQQVLQSHFKFDGNDKQQRQDVYDSDSEASYFNLGWEFKRRRLLTVERKKDLLPASSRPLSTTTLQTIDFEQLTASSEWAKRVLFETLSANQVDELVGLATTLGEGSINLAAASNQSSHNDDCNYQANEDSESAPPPSFLNALQQNPLMTLCSGPPLPPSFLRYIQTKASEQLAKDEQKKAADSKLDDSAAVAIGMALEDSITASLLPLAGLHVLRCRAIEDMAVTEETTSSPKDYSKLQTALHPITGSLVQLNMDKIPWKTEKAFDEWTLPPNEAIMKLLEQGLISQATPQFLPDACRSIYIGPNDKPLSDSSSAASVPNLSETEKIQLWSKLLHVSPSVIKSNPDLIGIFLSHTTTNQSGQGRYSPQL